MRDKKLTELEKDLFHVELAVCDAIYEIEGKRGNKMLMEILETARDYINNCWYDIQENKRNAKDYKRQGAESAETLS